MKLSPLHTIITAGTIATLVGLTGQAAQAGQFHNDWNYAIDSFSDGSGGASFEIKGLAIKETTDSIFVALTGGTPLAGVSHSGAADGNIGWGDLFLNFSGNNFKTASNASNLFGIRFAGTNDSGVASTGVYKNVQAKSVTAENQGYTSLKQYYNAGFDKTNTQGTDLATSQAVYQYYYGDAVANNPTTSNTNPIGTVISSGTKVGNISFLTNTALTAAGLNFGHFGATGSQVIGFQFDRSLLGSDGGNFMANLFLECGNDGVALRGDLEEVPEPLGFITFAAVGLMGSAALRRKLA